MTLRLHDVSKSVDGQVHIHPVNLEMQKGSMNVLLGPTSAGKTSLMRLMAGLDRPDTGKIYWNGEDVTGARVQKRDVAMVYQQFVNYPSMSVYDNIASPLRIQKRSSEEIEARVREMAELLQLTSLLERKPDEISGGQQQRCAIARALAKDVGLVLMDEPLANLDYKLREELRSEIPRLFANSGSIFVYATTDPEEALLLGGQTATLWEGRVTQFGPSMEVYRSPIDEITARVFSDPPMNFMSVRKDGRVLHFPNGQTLGVGEALGHVPDGELQAGFRAHHLELGAASDANLSFDAKLAVTEITGSETFIHVDCLGQKWTGLVPGVHPFTVDQTLPIALPPQHILYFDADGNLAAPAGPETFKLRG